MKFDLLISIKTAKINGIFWSESTNQVIYPANKQICWHDKFHAQLRTKKFYNLKASSLTFSIIDYTKSEYN